LGGICGTGPVAFLVEKIGWRNSTYILSAIVVILLIATTLFRPNPKPSPENKTMELKLLSGLKAIAKNPKAWIAGFYGAISYLPLSAMAELWGIPFMEQRYGISTEKASISSMLIFIGFGLGGIFTAKIAEKINSYKKTIIISSALMLVTFTVAIYSNSIGYYSYLSLILILGVCSGTNTLTFTLASALVPKEFMGTSTGFMNMLIMSSGILFQSLLGKLLDFFRNGLVTDSGEPIYNITMYRSAFLVIALSMIFAVIAALFINDIKRKEEK
jgi:MFS family permease